METRVWLHSLFSAAVSGGSSAFLAAIVDPGSFNTSSAGLRHLGTVFILGSAIGVANLLKSSPLPITEVTASTTTTTSVTAVKSGE